MNIFEFNFRKSNLLAHSALPAGHGAGDAAPAGAALAWTQSNKLNQN